MPGDPEGRQGPGVVAGVVTEGGGEVDRPRPAEHPEREVRKVTMTCGRSRCRGWEASSA
jgi:hypothetical protein